MKTSVLLIAMLSAGTALSAEYSGARENQEEACTFVLGEARKAGFEISKFDCYCDYVPETKKHSCSVDSTGAKRIQSGGKSAPSNQAQSPQPAAKPAAKRGKPDRVQCAAMAKHKEKKLEADIQRAQKSINAATNSLELIADVREGVTDRRKDQESYNTAFKLTLVTKLTNDLISDIMKSYPPTSMAMKEAEGVATIVQTLISTSTKVVSYAESPGQYKAKELIRKVPVAGDIAVGAFNLGKNMQSLKEARQEGDDIIEITDEGLASQERLIEKLKLRLDTSTYRLKLLKKLASEIDKACS